MQEAVPGSLRRVQMLWRATIVLLVVAAPWSVYRASTNGCSDFASFESAGRFVLEHGTRHPKSALYRYLPSIDVACVPLTWLPIEVSATIWYVLNAGCWLLVLRMIRREFLGDLATGFAGEVTVAVGLLAIPLAIDGFLLGGFHAVMLWFMLAGLWRALHGKENWGGCLLGLATWLKLLPAVAIAYLVWRRKWKAVGTAILTVAAVDATLSISTYGWAESSELHADWFWGDAVGTGDRQLTGQTNDDEDRITNQSVLVVMRRLLTSRGGFTQLAFADLSPNQMAIAVSIVGGLMAGGVWWAMHRGTQKSAPDAPGDLALVALCTIWFSPVVWSYHFIAAAPALAVALGRRQIEWQRWALIGVWCLGMSLFAIELGRAAGHMLWTTFVIGGSLAWTMHPGSRSKLTTLKNVAHQSDADEARLSPILVESEIHSH